MVSTARKYIYEEKHQVNILDKPVKWTSIPLSSVFEKGKRLEAAVFDIESKQLHEMLEKLPFPLITLDGENGLISESFYPGRFKRIYCKKGRGHEFFLPSQLTDIYPKAEKWISKLTKTSIDNLRLKEKTLLLTRSGTVGNVSIVSSTLEGAVFSDDVIRTTFKEEVDLGYVYAFLKSETGSLIFQTNKYGSVITHVEPEHLKETLIPNPPLLIKKKIHEMVMESYRLRDESNNLIDKATKLLIDSLELPPIESLKEEAESYSKEINNFSVKLSDLNGRLEANYHLPLVQVIEKHMSKNADILPLGDSSITEDIILPGRFKRIYVEKGYGHVFIGGKEIGELDPVNKKYLSVKHHSKQIQEQLIIEENMTLITCSGTLGKVAFVPKHWQNWTVNQHVLRVVNKESLKGYMYIWLSTEYGKILTVRNKYGSVVDEITDLQIAEMSVPILKDVQIISEINNLALKSNELRYEAYLLEQKAIKTMNEEVLGL